MPIAQLDARELRAAPRASVARSACVRASARSGQLGDLRRSPSSRSPALVRGAGRRLRRRLLDPQPLALERERVRVAARQRVLDDGTRRRLARPRARSRSDRISVSTPERRSSTASRLSDGAPSERQGPQGLSSRRLGPCLRRRARSCSASRRPRRRGADATLDVRLERALRVPHVDPARTAALAVDLRTGDGRLRAQPRARARSRVEPEAAGRLRGAGAARARRTGSTPRSSAPARSSATSGTATSGCAATATRRSEPPISTRSPRDVAAWGIRRVDGAVIADESWFDTAATAPGWKPSFYIERVAAALRARRRPGLVPRPDVRTIPHSRRPRCSGRHSEAAGVTVARRTRIGTLATTRAAARAGRLGAARPRSSRFMGRESDNFTAEMLVKQLGAVYAGRGLDGGGRARRCGTRSPPRGSRSPASASPTGRGCRGSTG